MKHAKVLIAVAAFTFVAALATMLLVGGVNAQPTPPNADDRQSTRTARVKLRGEKILERTTIRTDRLEKLNTKAIEIARKMEQKGADVGQAIASFTTATEKMSEARAAITEAQTALGQLETAEDPMTVINNFKSSVGKTYTALGMARQSIVQGIQALKVAKGTGAATTN